MKQIMEFLGSSNKLGDMYALITINKKANIIYGECFTKAELDKTIKELEEASKDDDNVEAADELVTFNELKNLPVGQADDISGPEGTFGFHFKDGVAQAKK